MRYLLALTLALLPTTCLAQWGRSTGAQHQFTPRPYVQMPLRPIQPYHTYSSQTMYLPNARYCPARSTHN